MPPVRQGRGLRDDVRDHLREDQRLLGDMTNGLHHPGDQMQLPLSSLPVPGDAASPADCVAVPAGGHQVSAAPTAGAKSKRRRAAMADTSNNNNNNNNNSNNNNSNDDMWWTERVLCEVQVSAATLQWFSRAVGGRGGRVCAV